MNASRGRPLTLLLLAISLIGCASAKEESNKRLREVTVTTAQTKTVSLTQPFVGQIRSHHRVEIRAPESGYLANVVIKEGQEVKQDDLLFQITPTNTKVAREKQQDLQVISVRAPFGGGLSRLLHQQGSFIEKSEPVTTLSDNDEMWVYFNVPESRYLSFKSENLEQNKDDFKIELILSNGQKFDHQGKLGAIGAVFNAETGSIPFRADFPNPEHQLHHGQRGTVLISRVQKDALVIPQRAAFELLEKRYVYVVDKDNVVHQRRIEIENELDDLFVIKSGITTEEKIVLDGVGLLRDGEQVKYDDHSKKVATNQQ